MLDFSQDESVFFNTGDFGVSVFIASSDVKFTAIFNYITEEEGTSISRYPTLTCSTSAAKDLSKGTEVLIAGGNVDRKFTVRNTPEFSFDDETVEVKLKDVFTDTFDENVNKYLPQ